MSNNNNFIQQKVLEVLNKSLSERSKFGMREVMNGVLEMPYEAFKGQQLPSKSVVLEAISSLIGTGQIVMNSDWTLSLGSELPEQENQKTDLVVDHENQQQSNLPIKPTP